MNVTWKPSSLGVNESNASDFSSKTGSLSDRMQESFRSHQTFSTFNFNISSKASTLSSGNAESIQSKEADKVEESDTDWIAELTARLKRLQLDKDPDKAFKQVMGAVENLRDSSGKMVFDSVDQMALALHVAHGNLSSSESEPVDPTVERLKDVAWSVRMNLWGMEFQVNKMREDILSPDPEDYGSPTFFDDLYNS